VAILAPGAGRGLAAPAMTALAVMAGAAVLGVVSPELPGHYPPCPFQAVTGLFCPGCGGLRAVHALVHGDVVTAVQRNVLVVVLLPCVVLAWVAWIRRRLHDPMAVWYPSAAASRALLVALVGFGVLRNLPGFAFLAP
jgi:hypothetical protein